MHYRVQGHLIASELAAKPEGRAAAAVVAALREAAPFRKSADVGCGKLRYAAILAEVSQQVTVVDSEEQLSRTQVLRGRRTTVREEAGSRWSNVEVESVKEFCQKNRQKLDFALCANVLSAVPSLSSRRTLLKGIRSRLRQGGRMLLVTQFRNSHYTALEDNPAAERYRDGWLIRRGRRAAFYAMLDVSSLQAHLHGIDFSVERSWTVGQSALVMARAV